MARKQRWYHSPDLFDSGFAWWRPWIIIALLAAFIFLPIIGGIAFAFYADKSGCEQRAASRPDIRAEWHWNTGCMLLKPDATVVISR